MRIRESDSMTGTDAERHMRNLSLQIYDFTPLAMMFRGFGNANRAFGISNVAARHLQDATAMQTRAMLNLCHATAAIWLEDTAVTPMSTVIKLDQTQAALLRHWREVSADSIARFTELSRTAGWIVTHRDD